MGTTFTNGDVKLASDQAIVTISDTLLSLKAFSFGVEMASLSKGSSKKVFLVGDSEDKKEDFNRTTNNYFTDNGGKHAWVDVELEYHKKQTTRIPPDDYLKLSTEDLAGIFAKDLAKLCKSIVAVPFKEITTTNFPGKPYVITDVEKFSKKDAGKIETMLGKLVGTSAGERNLILDFDCFDSLRDSLTGLYVSPHNYQALADGTIPGISGFKNVIRTTALEIGEEPGVYLAGIATNKSGIAMAFGNCKPPPAFRGDIETAVEPITGIPIQFTVDYDPANRDYIATVETLFGCQVVESKGILRITTEVKKAS